LQPAKMHTIKRARIEYLVTIAAYSSLDDLGLPIPQ
jgi:hypothetical protein